MKKWQTGRAIRIWFWCEPQGKKEKEYKLNRSILVCTALLCRICKFTGESLSQCWPTTTVSSSNGISSGNFLLIRTKKRTTYIKDGWQITVYQAVWRTVIPEREETKKCEQRLLQLTALSFQSAAAHGGDLSRSWWNPEVQSQSWVFEEIKAARVLLGAREEKSGKWEKPRGHQRAPLLIHHMRVSSGKVCEKSRENTA